MIRNKLQLNAGKTDVLVASSARSRKFKPVPSPLDICDEPITPSPFFKNLGVIVDSHLNMERQVNTVGEMRTIIFVEFRAFENFWM